MIDKTSLEACALEAALRPLGEIAVEFGIDKPLVAYSREEALTVIEAIVSGYQDYFLGHSDHSITNINVTCRQVTNENSKKCYLPFHISGHSHHKEGETDPMTLDFNHRPTLSEKINGLIDTALADKTAHEPKRDYLGASRLGVSCSRALQYEYTHTPRDKPFSGKLLRIFEMGHALEGMALNWLEKAGFDIAVRQPDGNQFGFSTAGGRIQGHVDGIIFNAPPEVGMTFPALWECKSMNAKSWKQTVDKGVRAAKPVYAVQVALYQAYMEAVVPGISKNPALFTAVNKDSSEIYHELVAFDAAIAQEASDRGVNILRSLQAGEMLPRISMDPDHFECRFCDWKDHCWADASGTGIPGKETP